METILDRIVASKKDEIRAAKERLPLADLSRRLPAAPPARDFRAALLHGPGMGVIAEVKKASPSAGVMRHDFDPVAIARTYEAAGANCLSVLTDEPFFQGKLEYLVAIRQAVSLPLLRKDFVLDEYQVVEARVAGADAVLLIAEILDDAQLRGLFEAIEALGMQALVELYDPENLPRVLGIGATLVGVNNRDLRSFVTSLEQTLSLAPLVPADRCLISESGIRTADDMRRLRAAGVKGVLIGETFMRSGDIGRDLRELRGGAS
ncbi:MAG: indole-3-glycerol phosphate synthase TrpC [Planctomycetota bacterium]